MDNIKWRKKRKDDKIWWGNIRNVRGMHYFTFDKIKIYQLFRDYPYNMSKEELEIFNNENEYWTNFFKDRLK